jgi:hypothetical protein
LFADEEEEEDTFLIRVPHKVKASIVWKDERKSIELPDEIPVTISWGKGVLDQLRKLRHSNDEFELDFRLMPLPFGKEGERPGLPHLLMMVESRTGVVAQFDLTEPGKAKADLWGMIPVKLGDWFLEMGAIPKALRLSSDMLQELLEPLAENLNFKLKHSDYLPGIDEATESMIRWAKTGEL